LVINQIRAVQAWVAYQNATQGGIDCHPINYITADDGGSPANNQQLVQQLVQQDHVIAFVDMTGALAGNASVSYLTQQGIPVIGDEGGEQWFYQSPDYFPQESSGSLIDESTFAAIAAVGKAAGKLKLATISCIEASVCSAVYGDAPAFSQQYGLNLVYRGQASLTTPDFTANCESAQQAGAQLFIIGLDQDSVERLLQDCANIGYHPIYGATSAAVNATIASDSLASNMVIGLPNAFWNASGNAAISQFQSVMAKYAPGIPVDLTSEPGWVSAQLFALAAQNIPNPPTSQGILNGLWAIKNNDLGGLTYPITFTKGQDAPQTFCYWVAQVTNAKIVSPNGGIRACS
jgi:ABC-type branched-subunit amino acid transport system substrate-binding protein